MTLPHTIRTLFKAISRPVVTRKPAETGEETGNSATGPLCAICGKGESGGNVAVFSGEFAHFHCLLSQWLPDSSPFTNLTPPDPNPHKRVQVKDGCI